MDGREKWNLLLQIDGGNSFQWISLTTYKVLNEDLPKIIGGNVAIFFEVK